MITLIGAFLGVAEFMNLIAVGRATEPPAALAAAIARDPHVAQCAHEESMDDNAYVARAFDLRNLTLRGGEAMTAVVATDACLFLGQSTRVMIYERRNGSYRRALNDVSLPGDARIGEDGTAILPTHETMETIFEAAYVWNGSAYAFSPSRSSIYDVSLGIRHPYEVPIRFAPGTHQTIVSGSAARNFGDRFAFQARAAQTLTVELLRHTGSLPTVYLATGDNEHIIADVAAHSWTGRLSPSGTYVVGVFGRGESDATTIATYALRLTIR